jgi:hypothetical protein
MNIKAERIKGFKRVYQAESFPTEFEAMFGKDKGETERYRRWLRIFLSVLDEMGVGALALDQFERLRGEDSRGLCALRHPHSKINERYIYIYASNEKSILLTAFKEKSAKDYAAAIRRAKGVLCKLEDLNDED